MSASINVFRVLKMMALNQHNIQNFYSPIKTTS